MKTNCGWGLSRGAVGLALLTGALANVALPSRANADDATVRYAEAFADNVCSVLMQNPKPSLLDALIGSVREDGFTRDQAKAIVAYGIKSSCYEGGPLEAKLAWQDLTGEYLG